MRVLARLLRPAAGRLHALPDNRATQARAMALSVRLSLGGITIFIYSNIVHCLAEKGLPVQGGLPSLVANVPRFGFCPSPARRLGRQFNERFFDARNLEVVQHQESVAAPGRGREAREAILLHRYLSR